MNTCPAEAAAASLAMLATLPEPSGEYIADVAAALLRVPIVHPSRVGVDRCAEMARALTGEGHACPTADAMRELADALREGAPSMRTTGWGWMLMSGMIDVWDPIVLPEPPLAKLHKLSGLCDGFDGEDSPAPSVESIACAADVIAQSTAAGIIPSDVDTDVMGGVALWFFSGENYQKSDKSVWVSIRNTGATTVIFKDHVTSKITSAKYGPTSITDIASFLKDPR